MTTILRSWPQYPNERVEMVNDTAIPAPSPAADPAGSAAIEVAHLIKLYKTTRAVDDVSFNIARGSITGLLGGNGAGKTTTIAMIMGLVLPTSGRIQVLGHPMPEHADAPRGRQHQSHDHRDGGGLAGAVAAEQPGDAAAGQREGDAVHRAGLLVDLDQAIDLDGRGQSVIRDSRRA